MRYAFFCLICCIFLAACQQKYDHHFLLTHPEILKSQLKKCQAAENLSASESSYCELVESSAQEFSALLMSQQQDPLEFGKRILNTQTQCAAGKKAAEQHCREVQVLLAVMSLSSPE